VRKNTTDPLIDGFLSYLGEVRRLKARTLIDIRCTLNKVIAAMLAIRPGKSLWELSLDDYMLWLGRGRQENRSPRTLAKDISHVRGLLDYAWRNGRSDRNVLDGFDLQDDDRRKPPRVLSLEEARRLVNACPSKTPEERRNRAMILLLYGCGLRTQELCRLDVQDINIERQELFVKRSKGDIQRWIPVPEGVWTELLAYLAERKGVRGALFRTTAKRQRIRDNTVLATVAEAVRRAGLSGDITPRTLRHSFATHLMDAGVDLAVISVLMGHRSPNETGVYLHALPGKREQAVGNLKVFESSKGAKP
jgi:integrase/recombinase XerD